MTDNIVWETYTGYQNSSINIATITPWSLMFKGSKSIRFLGKDGYSAGGVFDVLLEKSGAVRIGTYNFSDSTKIKEQFPAVQEALIKQLRELSTAKNRNCFSVYLKGSFYKVLDSSDFSDHFPDYIMRDELFIFEDVEIDEEYPQIYCMMKSIRSHDLLNFLDVIAYCSSNCYIPAKEPTKFGKEFTYALTQNNLMRRPEYLIPNLVTIELPDNGKDSIRDTLTTTNLKQLHEKCGVNKLIENNKNQTPAKKSTNAGSKLTAEQESILKYALEKEEINVSDIFAEGLGKIIEMFAKTDFVVNVFMNIPQIAKKGCIFEGKLHLLPYLTDSEVITDLDYGYTFDVSDDYIIVCTEETYPKKVSKIAGKEN